MKRLVVAAVVVLVSTPALAQSGSKVLTSLPRDAITVTDYYKQNVYDPSDNKIGDIKDVLIDNDGRVAAFIVAVGGILGAAEKDVAAAFQAVKATRKDNKWYLVMNATKDELKNAPGFKYDSSSTRWVPEKK